MKSFILAFLGLCIFSLIILSCSLIWLGNSSTELSRVPQTSQHSQQAN